ncbi:hypothetical protein Tco_0850579, partial [Tanacetum coccineum]
DSESLREEIDIFPGPDDSIPPGIESDDDVVEDIPVDVPNILPTHPTLHMDFDFFPSHNDLGSDLDVSSPFRDRNKIYDPRICIEVKSTSFLATHSPVIDTLLPFSSENKDKVFNHGVLAYKEKSPPSSSHRGLKAFQLSPESPMMIHGDNTPNLGGNPCLSLHNRSSSMDFPDFEASRALGFSFTRASHPQLYFRNPISKSYRLTGRWRRRRGEGGREKKKRKGRGRGGGEGVREMIKEEGREEEKEGEKKGGEKRSRERREEIRVFSRGKEGREKRRRGEGGEKKSLRGEGRGEEKEGGEEGGCGVSRKSEEVKIEGERRDKERRRGGEREEGKRDIEKERGIEREGKVRVRGRKKRRRGRRGKGGEKRKEEEGREKREEEKQERKKRGEEV